MIWWKVKKCARPPIEILDVSLPKNILASTLYLSYYPKLRQKLFLPEVWVFVNPLYVANSIKLSSVTVFLT